MNIVDESASHRDWRYRLVEPKQELGTQCGVCWMKFDYNKSYGYSCGNTGCPMRSWTT